MRNISETNSTHDELIKNFVKCLRRVAELDSQQEDETVNVILSAMEQAGFRDRLDELDKLRDQVANAPACSPTVSDTPVVAEETATAAKKPKRVTKTATTDAKPTKRKTGYNIFIKDMVTKEKKSMQDAAKIWKELTDADKKPYSVRADEINQASVSVPA